LQRQNCDAANDALIEAILWDNDGVLVDTEHLYFQATQRVLASVGVMLTEQQYIDLFLVEGRGAWQLVEARGVGDAEIARLREQRNELYGRLLREGPLVIPGIVETLDALRGRYVMGVVTSSRKDHFDLIHEHTGLLQYFDFVLTASDYPRVKPYPDPYLAAVERSGVGADSCIAIEDSERGLEAATLAGVRCLVVPTALTRGGRFAQAQRVLATASEIPAALSDRSIW
jgi:HAD superfamily hydrolase (TIGR01509 family)